MRGLVLPGVVAAGQRQGLPPFTVATLTIPASTVGANLAGFPVLLDLADMPPGFWAAVAGDGADIRVLDAAFAGRPVDVVAINTGTETGTVFFSADLLAATDNVFYVQAGSGAAAPAVTDPLGRNAVWSAYHRVFAFAGNSGVERTGSGVSLTVGPAPGITGGLLDFRFSGATYARCSTSDYAVWTMGAVIKGSIGVNNQVIVDYRKDGTSAAQLIYRGLSGGGPSLAMFTTDVALNHHMLANFDEFTVRRHVAMAQNGGAQRRSFLAGLKVREESIAVTHPSPGALFTMGRDGGDNYSGYYEVGYLRAGYAAEEWIAAEAASWVAPSAFYAVI